VLGKTGAIDRALFKPDTLPPSAVLSLALLPPVVAGLILFRLAAAEMLVLAVAVGAIAHLTGRLIKQPLSVSPVIPAVVAVGLIGAGASPAWALGAATAAATLELARVRIAPGFRIHAGLVAYSALYLLGHGGPAAYLKPMSAQPFPEPIALWQRFYDAGASPIEAVTLYVGNVAGPVFATSLLAVVIGAAWLWYARRLRLGVVISFGLGACIPITLMRWNFGYQLDSGPLWFVVALAFAERSQLPPGVAARTLMGFAAGVVVLAARARGFAIEAVPIGIVGLQIVVALVEGIGWLAAERDLVRERSRRLRARAAQIRFANPLQRGGASSERPETRSA
jgi:Na+-transporting NADH:ubiquinone oxidoreductase subunit NqrB